MNLQFLLIDPQNDFARADGSLFVPGADLDSLRLAALLNRCCEQISAIHITLDTHHLLDIAHPLFWVNAQGEAPPPFTIIREEDVLNGMWKTARARDQVRAEAYVRALKANGRYDLCIWPPHCLFGTAGHNVVQPVANAILAWESTVKSANYILKGMNPWTEHYSAVRADVLDEEDSSTQLNAALLRALAEADVVAVSGQALSHCVANTVRDIAAHWRDEPMDKMVLIEDTCSPVPGFEGLARQFIEEMRQRGMRLVTSSDFMC